MYRNFLEESLLGFLGEYVCNIPTTGNEKCMWFMHDGAPAHFSIVGREFLTTYKEDSRRRITEGCNGIRNNTSIVEKVQWSVRRNLDSRWW